jgi:hypothetical protein
MKNYQKRIWNQIQATPNKTSKELGDIMGIDQSSVSHYLTVLFRRNMVERIHRTFINENVRQQTTYEYKVVGTKYCVKPVALVPANPRKYFSEIVITQPAPTVTLTPYGLDTLDIDSLTVKQARDLYNKLGAFFGGVK